MYYIFEYDVNSFINDATDYTISLYVYKVNVALGDLFKTNYFTENTEVQSSLIKKGLIDIWDRVGDYGVNHRDPYTHIWYLTEQTKGLVPNWVEEAGLEPVELVTA